MPLTLRLPLREADTRRDRELIILAQGIAHRRAAVAAAEKKQQAGTSSSAHFLGIRVVSRHALLLRLLPLRQLLALRLSMRARRLASFSRPSRSPFSFKFPLSNLN